MFSQHDKPVLNLQISINIQQFPPSFFLTRAGKSLIPSYQSITLENVDSVSTSSVDSDFTYIHPDQNNYNSTHFYEQFGEFSSLDNLATNTTTEKIDRSKLEITNSIEFSLNKREWDIICPQINAKLLNTEWTYIFSKKLSMSFPFCVITFLYHRINKKSTFRNSSYLVGEATCKFKNCLKFQFWLKDIPELGTENVFINVNVIGTISYQHFDSNTSYSRKLSGQERLVVAGQLTQILQVTFIITNLNNQIV